MMASSEKQVSILIVDDLPINLLAIEAILKSLQQKIYFAKSGNEALRLILQHEFAVILLDINMPGLDGLDTAKLIRSREKNNYTPIIFLTALDKNSLDLHEGYAIGVSDYIFKPVNPLILRSKVKVFIDLFTKSSLARKLQEELKNRQQAEENLNKQKQQLDMVKLEKLSTVKEMTSALAHELNQPLTAINNYIEGCIKRLGKNNFDLEQILSALKIVKHEAHRSGEILHRMNNFVRKNATHLEPTAVGDIFEDIKPLLNGLAKEHQIQIIYKIEAQDEIVVIDKIRIGQVLINLVKNSIEALSDFTIEERQIILEGSIDSQEKLILSVADNGPGIAQEHFPHLFNLYYSNKKNGMGMGLKICRTVIEDHLGHISVKNNATGGACFKMILPVCQKKQEIPQPHIISA